MAIPVIITIIKKAGANWILLWNIWVKSLLIEVKSGKEYKKHSALDNVLQKNNYGIKKSIVFSNGNVEKKGKIAYLPIYMIMFLEEENIDFADISIGKFKL